MGIDASSGEAMSSDRLQSGSNQAQQDGGHHLNGEMAYKESSSTLCRGRVEREDE